jgi:hypothetical protein
MRQADLNRVMSYGYDGGKNGCRRSVWLGAMTVIAKGQVGRSRKPYGPGSGITLLGALWRATDQLAGKENRLDVQSATTSRYPASYASRVSNSA